MEQTNDSSFNEQGTPPESQPPTELTEETKPKRFPILYLGLLFLLTVFAFLGYQNWQLRQQISQEKPTPVLTVSVSPTQDPTANWKKYTNTKYSFSFRYPTQYFFKEDLIDEANYDEIGDLYTAFAHMRVRVINDIDIYEDQSSENVAKREIMDSGFRYSIETVTINTYQVAITHVNRKPENWIATIKNPKKNQFLEFNADNKVDKYTFDQILSTFKFLDQVGGQTRSVTVAVRRLETGYGIGSGDTYEYPSTIQIEKIPEKFVERIEAYGVTEMVVLGPKGLDGKGSIGANGVTGFDLFDGRSPKYMKYEDGSACYACNTGGAAPYFERAKELYEKQYPNTPLPAPIPGLETAPLSDSIKTYSYTLPVGVEVNGVARFVESPDMNFRKIEIGLPSADHDLAIFLLNRFVEEKINKE